MSKRDPSIQENEQLTYPELRIQYIRLSSVYSIPKMYLATFLKMVEKKEIKDKKQLLRQEINKILQGKSLPQLVQYALDKRQSVIKNLKKMMLKAKINKTHLNLANTCELLKDIRLLNLKVIQLISTERLKNNIQSDEDKYGRLVINKLSADIDFLRVSPIRKYIQFANSNDPLFIYPTKKFWNVFLSSNSNRGQITHFFELSQSMIGRLNRANELISEKTHSSIHSSIDNHKETQPKNKKNSLFPELPSKKSLKSEQQSQEGNSVQKSSKAQNDNARSQKKYLQKTKNSKIYHSQKKKIRLIKQLETAQEKSEVDQDQQQYKRKCKLKQKLLNWQRRMRYKTEEITQTNDKQSQKMPKIQKNQKQQEEQQPIKVEEHQNESIEPQKQCSNEYKKNRIYNIMKKIKSQQKNKYQIELEKLKNWKQIKNLSYISKRWQEKYSKNQQESNSNQNIYKYVSNRQCRLDKEVVRQQQLQQEGKQIQIKKNKISLQKERNNASHENQNQNSNVSTPCNRQPQNNTNNDHPQNKSMTPHVQNTMKNKPSSYESLPNKPTSISQNQSLIPNPGDTSYLTQLSESARVHEDNKNKKLVSTERSINPLESNSNQLQTLKVQSVTLPSSLSPTHQEPETVPQIPIVDYHLQLETRLCAIKKFIQYFSTPFKLNQQQLEQYFCSFIQANDRLNIVLGKLSEKIVLVSVFHPIITQNKKVILILLAVTKNNLPEAVTKLLLNSLLKYLFVADPSQQIYFLIHKNLTTSQAVKNIESLPYFKGTSNLPFSLPFLESSTLTLKRLNNSILNKKHVYTDILAIQMQLVGKSLLPYLYTSQDIVISAKFMDQIKQHEKVDEHDLKLRKCTSEDELKLSVPMQANNITFMIQSFSETLHEMKCCQHKNLLCIKTCSPLAYSFDLKSYFYLFIKSQHSNHYFFIINSALPGGPTTKQSVLSFISEFKLNFEDKQKNEIFQQNQKQVVVGLPPFSKTASLKLGNTQSINLYYRIACTQSVKKQKQFQLNTPMTIIKTPFFVGVIEITSNQKIRFDYCFRVRSEHELNLENQ